MTRPIYPERQKVRTTEQLRYEIDRDPQRFQPGLYFNTRAGDVVRINDTTWMSVHGTLWKHSQGRWVCFGHRSWAINGRAYDACPAVPSLDDLTRRIPKPAWVEGVAA